MAVSVYGSKEGTDDQTSKLVQGVCTRIYMVYTASKCYAWILHIVSCYIVQWSMKKLASQVVSEKKHTTV